MCGIVGLVGLDASRDRATTLVSEMNARIAHRGPDGGGLITHADATIAMKRLAIVDIAHGAQPMANEDESVVLVYNGEIYNAPELRRELEERGVRFRTRSDTEVILRLYEHAPNDLERRLAGMWAFAIHDRRHRRVVLSRDRFGIKPLFVADTGRAVAFASELTAFDRTGTFASLFEVNSDAAHAMLAWSYVPGTRTIFEGVRRLEPGTRLTIDLKDNSRRTDRFYTLRPSADAARVRDLDEACETTEVLLRRSVTEHLESDVPIATFLSGGVDSSLVSALLAEIAPNRIKAYCVGFREKAFDESPFAVETAKRIGMPLQVEHFDEGTARAHVADALTAFDEPFGDSSSLAVFMLSRTVARDFKVALGGDGGDEAFAGYKKHTIVEARRLLGPARAILANQLARLPSSGDRTRAWTEGLRTLRRLSSGLSGPDGEAYVRLTQVGNLALTAPLIARTSGARSFEEAELDRFEGATGTVLQRTLASDLGNVLPNDMLTKVDRASMACHLEARVPFLDHRVVEWGLGLPSRFTLGTITGRRGKVVLRELHERRFGRRLARRKKQGFRVPVERWLRGPLSGACDWLFDAKRLDRHGVLASSALGNGRYKQWLRNEPVLLWHAFALAVWCEVNLGDGKATVLAMV